MKSKKFFRSKSGARVQNNALFCSLLFFFFFYFSFFTCFTQNSIIDVDENAQNRIMAAPVHPCDLYANINHKKLSIIDNNKQIPAYELYENQWDTLYIRGTEIDIPFFENQLKIILVHDENTPFAFPVSGFVSIGYVKNKGKQHAGVDFQVQKKEPVVACFDGVVRIAKKYEEYGNTVVVRHFNGLETVYAQLDHVSVVTEQKVKAGELIGYVGITNPAKKNALHFETRFFNEFFSPEKVINFSERKLHNNLLILSPTDFIPVPLIKPGLPVYQEQIKHEHPSSQQQLLNSPSSVPVYHTVERGETILKICTKYHITEQQLRSLNNIKGDHIELGQKLRVK